MPRPRRGKAPARPVCPVCAEPVLIAWIRTGQELPQRTLLNPRQDPDGPIAAFKDAAGILIGRTLTEGETPPAYEHRYQPHATTCVHPQAQHARDGITTWSRRTESRR